MRNLFIIATLFFSLNASAQTDSTYTQFYDNGILHVKGDYKDGLQTGQWYTFYDNGELHTIGSFVNGLEDGLWGIFHENGKLMQEEEWNMGGLWAVSAWYTITGDILDPGTLKDGEGVRINYYSNNTVEAKCGFFAGRPHGEWKYYYPDGSLAEEGQFMYGVKSGLWRYYDEKGNLTETIDHNND